MSLQVLNPRLVAGGGAVEMSVSQALTANAAHNTPYRAVAHALGQSRHNLSQSNDNKVFYVITSCKSMNADCTHERA